MKKVIALVAAALLCCSFALTGCSNGNSATSAAPSSNTSSTK